MSQNTRCGKMIEDYYNFPMGSDFEQSVNHPRGPRWWPQIGAAGGNSRVLPRISVGNLGFFRCWHASGPRRTSMPFLFQPDSHISAPAGIIRQRRYTSRPSRAKPRLTRSVAMRSPRWAALATLLQSHVLQRFRNKSPICTPALQPP